MRINFRALREESETLVLKMAAEQLDGPKKRERAADLLVGFIEEKLADEHTADWLDRQVKLPPFLEALDGPAIRIALKALRPLIRMGAEALVEETYERLSAAGRV